MQTPPAVTPEEREQARQKLLIREKEVTRARDALAAERRRMPWTAVEADHEVEGRPGGRSPLHPLPGAAAGARGEFGRAAGGGSRLDLFGGRRQLIVYRAFFEPGVNGWPDHACVGCSLMADPGAHLAPPPAPGTSLFFAAGA